MVVRYGVISYGGSYTKEYVCNFNLTIRGIFERHPFYVYSPPVGSTVYHEYVDRNMSDQELESIPQSYQSRENEFYVVVDGNHRLVVWHEL